MAVDVLSMPTWILGIPAILGAIGIVFYKHKQGEPVINSIGKVIIGFGAGYFMGGIAAMKLGIDRFSGSFCMALVSPALLTVMEDRLKGWFNK